MTVLRQVGLINTNNICYANCVIQSIAACIAVLVPSILKWTESDHTMPTKPATKELHRLITSVSSHTNIRGENVDVLVKLMSELHPNTIEYGEFNDAAEFMMLLFDMICNNRLSSRDICFGKSIVSTICNGCQKAYIRRHESGLITLYCENTGQSKCVVDMGELLHKQFETIGVDDWICDACNHKGGQQRMTFTELPKVMGICFANKPTRSSVVISKTVNFHMENLKKLTYRIRGVIMRHFYHFNCVIFGAEDTLSWCDDNVVTLIEDKDAKDHALRQMSKYAFCLLYELIDE